MKRFKIKFSQCNLPLTIFRINICQVFLLEGCNVASKSPHDFTNALADHKHLHFDFPHPSSKEYDASTGDAFVVEKEVSGE